MPFGKHSGILYDGVFLPCSTQDTADGDQSWPSLSIQPRSWRGGHTVCPARPTTVQWLAQFISAASRNGSNHIHPTTLYHRGNQFSFSNILFNTLDVIYLLYCHVGMPSSSVGRVFGHQWLSRWLKFRRSRFKSRWKTRISGKFQELPEMRQL